MEQRTNAMGRKSTWICYGKSGVLQTIVLSKKRLRVMINSFSSTIYVVC